MSIFYNKKEKGGQERENQLKVKGHESVQKYTTPTKKQAQSKSKGTSNYISANTKNVGKKLSKPSQQKEKKSENLNKKPKQNEQNQTKKKNRNELSKETDKSQQSPKHQNQDKTIYKVNLINEKGQKHRLDTQQRRYSQNESDVSVQSNNRKKKSFFTKKPVLTPICKPNSFNDTQVIKQTNQQQQEQASNTKNLGGLYLFYDQKKQKLKNKNQQVAKRKVADLQKSQRQQLESNNQFINQIHPKQQNSQRIPIYIYKKHTHKKDQSKKDHLKNKLGFIVNMFNNDQTASVSYYSESNSVKQESCDIQQEIPQIKQNTKDLTARKYQKPQKLQQQNIIKMKKKQQKQQVKQRIAKQEEVNIKVEQKLGKKQEVIKEKEINKQNSSKKQVIKKQYETVKPITDNSVKKSVKTVNKIKIIKHLNTEKNEEPQELNQMAAATLDAIPPKQQLPEQKDFKLKDTKTLKKTPIFNHNKINIILPEIKDHSAASTQNKNTQSDDQLLSLLKMNDEILEKSEKNGRKKTDNEQKNCIPLQNKQIVQDSGRRRIKTELDHYSDNFEPLNEEEQRFLTLLKKREEQLVKKIRQQFYNNPKIFHGQTQEFKNSLPRTQNFRQLSSPSHKVTYSNEIIQPSPTANLYQLGTNLPFLSSTTLAKGKKTSQILSIHPISSKAYQTPSNYFSNEVHQDYMNMQQNKRVRPYEDSLQELKYRQYAKERSQYANMANHWKNYIGNKEYKTLNPREKYEKLKRLIQNI